MPDRRPGIFHLCKSVSISEFCPNPARKRFTTEGHMLERPQIVNAQKQPLESVFFDLASYYL